MQQLPASTLLGFADAKPSEGIQKHHLPGASVGVIFPILNNSTVLEIPVKQYKEVKSKQKAATADGLSEWLIKKKIQGLYLGGFAHTHNQKQMAQLGMALIEELPCAHVEPHFDSYRLVFGSEHIDLPQAVALGYYFFTIMFGTIPILQLRSNYRSFFIAMDRFPGAGLNEYRPGTPIPHTQGAKFIWYLREHSLTGKGILEKQRSKGLICNLGTLDWWKTQNSSAWLNGKDHPHFILTD